MDKLNNFVLQEISSFPDEPHPDINYVRYNDTLDVLYMNLKSTDRPLLKKIVTELRSKFLESILSLLANDFRTVVEQTFGIPILGTENIDYENLIPQPEDPQITANKDLIRNEDTMYNRISVFLEVGSKIASKDIVNNMRRFRLFINVPKVEDKDNRQLIFGLTDNFQLNDRYKMATWKLIYNVTYYNICKMIGKRYSDGLLTIPFDNANLQIGILQSIFALLPISRTLPDDFDNQYHRFVIGYTGNYLLKSNTLGNIGEDEHLLNISMSYNYMDSGSLLRGIIDNYIDKL